MDNDWPKEELDFANRYLIRMLNKSVQVYHKVQAAVDQVRRSKLVQTYKNICNAYK